MSGRRRFTDPSPIIRALVVAAAGREPRSAVVVGNAPLDPSARRAAMIDAADVVVRMTTFALDAAEPRVGTRTDVVLVHRGLRPGPSTFDAYRSRIYLLAEPGRAYWEPVATPAWWPADLGLVPIPNRTVVDPLKRAMRIADGTASWPTTGTLAVHLLHALFPAMHIVFTGTSLAGPRAATGSFAHAWGSPTALTPEHRLRAERRVLASWVDAGFLRIES